MEVGVPRAVRRAERFRGHRADHVRRRREHLGVVEREAADRAHDLCAVDQRDALLRAELDGLQASRLERLGSISALALIDRLAFADQHQRRVGERREIA